MVWFHTKIMDSMLPVIVALLSITGREEQYQNHVTVTTVELTK